MNGDIIKCTTCGKEFIDQTTQKLQDSRRGIFINRCPYCYSIYTENTNKNVKKRNKFIYKGKLKNGGAHRKMSKHITKPNLDTEYIAKKVLGKRQKCDITENPKEFSFAYERTLPTSENGNWKAVGDYTKNTGGTYHVEHIKSYTPQELKQQEINNHIEKMKSPINNYKKYKGWWKYASK